MSAELAAVVVAEPTAMSDVDRRQRVISSMPQLAVEDVATRTFGTAWRGYSESEVRAFLKRVSEELAAARDKEGELNAAVDELEEQLRSPRPLSEQELLDALGEETARLLRTAREAADEIRNKSQERAAALVADATESAERTRAAADQVLDVRSAEAEQKVAEMLAEAQARVDGMLEAARGEASEIIDAARNAGREMHEEAKSARERVLGDLVRRRALLNGQIEELRAGRDRLLDAYRTVKRTFLDATEALSQVEARAAAERTTVIEVDVAAEVEAEIQALDGTPGDTAAADDAADDNDAATTVEAAPSETVDIAAAEQLETAADAAEPELAPAPAAPLDEVEEPGHGGEDDDDRSTGALADVDSLFARIRAGHSEAAVATAATTEPAAAVATVEAPAAAPATAEPEPVVDETPAATGAMSATDWRARRAHDIDSLLAPLFKRTKRTAQDDQNALLDAVRRHKGKPSAEKVMPDRDSARATWVEVLREPLETAYAAGRLAAGSEFAAPDLDIVELAADAVTAPLRQRLVAAVDSGDGSDTGGLVERIGARYREWKNQTLESALAEVLASTWARGVYDALPDGTVLRWVAYEEGRCSDCDDNALEPTTKGDAFPTGQAFPPAHPGCRCLLVPDEQLIAPAG